MRAFILLAMGFSFGLDGLPQAAASGGRIIGASITNSQIQLLFESTNGYSYQIQGNATLNNRFWSDSVPVVNASGSFTSVLAPAQAPGGFFKVLEFTNSVFWYDWRYYYQSEFLDAWGLGSTQSGYGHVDRGYEWYIDQADTGSSANNNCGPSSVTMAIKWFNPGFSKTAEDARNTYPAGGGWWYTSDIINYLNLHSVPHTASAFTAPDQLAALLEEGNLLVLCISTAYLTLDTAAEHRVGRFYSYASGHFLVVKGWRITNNDLFFEVYDPYSCHAIYADKTPKGRNRHLAASDLASAISQWWNYLIVVSPPAGGGGGAERSAWLKTVDTARIPHMWGR